MKRERVAMRLGVLLPAPVPHGSLCIFGVRTPPLFVIANQYVADAVFVNFFHRHFFFFLLGSLTSGKQLLPNYLVLDILLVLFVFFPRGVSPLQSDWSLSCDHGLDSAS